MAELNRHVIAAADAAAQRHPAHAGAIRHRLERLRSGLTMAHSRGAAVDDAAWEGYVTDLDAGLDELDKEIGRAAEKGASVDDVLTIHATGIELQGWRLQVSLPGVRPRLTAAELALDDYAAACANGTDKPAAALDAAMTDLHKPA